MITPSRDFDTYPASAGEKAQLVGGTLIGMFLGAAIAFGINNYQVGQQKDADNDAAKSLIKAAPPTILDLTKLPSSALVCVPDINKAITIPYDADSHLSIIQQGQARPIADCLTKAAEKIPSINQDLDPLAIFVDMGSSFFGFWASLKWVARRREAKRLPENLPTVAP